MSNVGDSGPDRGANAATVVAVGVPAGSAGPAQSVAAVSSPTGQDEADMPAEVAAGRAPGA